MTKVAEAIKDCAMSTTCIPGQDIIMVTHRIEQNKVFAYTGECFEAKDPNLARPVGQRIAREISQRSGLPIVFSHVRGNYFIFGVPRSR